MELVRRSGDGELCGFVEERDGDWLGLTVFGAVLGRHGRREDAVEAVLADGLASLADRWTLRHGETGDEETVCIAEASHGTVTLALGYYSLPDVPRLTITTEQLAAGEWELFR